MPKFLLSVSPVRITLYELQYEIEAPSAQVAEAIFRNRQPGAPIKLVRREKVTTDSPRQEVPVLVVAAPTASCYGETDHPQLSTVSPEV